MADEGWPEFPGTVAPDCIHAHSMSLRDWFAGMAMQGMLAGHSEDQVDKLFEPRDGPCRAYMVADAMLKERAK